MTKTCKFCGKAFDTSGRAQCCGVECLTSYWRARARERMRKVRIECPEKIRERRRKWRVDHLEAMHEQDRRYSAEHADRARERARKWAVEHPEKRREIQRRYHVSERGRASTVARKHTRRVRLNGITLTIATILELKAEYGGICPYCNSPIMKGHIDHVHAVSRGGTNERENLVWVCQRCNHQKRDMSLIQFLMYRMTGTLLAAEGPKREAAS